MMVTSAHAWAQEGSDACTEPTVPVGSRGNVIVKFGPSFGEESRRVIVDDLRGAVASQGLGLCVESAQTSVSTLTITQLSPSTVRIEVADSLTNKRVTRDVELAAEAEGPLALTIAVASDELLRATWAELSLTKRDGSATPAEREPSATDEPTEGDVSKEQSAAARDQQTEKPGADQSGRTSESSAVAPATAVLSRAAFEIYETGSTFLGADLAVTGGLGGRLRYGLWCGPRFGLSKGKSQLGTVSSQALNAGGSLGWDLLEAAQFGFGPQVSVAVGHVWFQGRAEPSDAETFEGSGRGLFVVPQAGLFADLRWRRLFVEAQVKAGFALRGLEVTDGSDTIGGISGFEVSSGLGLGVNWGTP